MAGRITFATLAGAMALMALSPPLLAAGHPLAALALRGFFSRLCHQDPARSLILSGSPAAVCMRCLGIYCGAAAGALLALARRLQAGLAQRIFWGAVVLNVLDVATELFHLHGNLPMPRFLLGASLGLSAGILLHGRERRESESASRQAGESGPYLRG